MGLESYNTQVQQYLESNKGLLAEWTRVLQQAGAFVRSARARKPVLCDAIAPHHLFIDAPPHLAL